MESGPGGGVRAVSIEWSRRIRDALDRDRFALHAQRIVDVASGETMRHELFLRMVEDDERVVAAGEFVVAAEEFGSIGEIDGWVTGKAIEIASSGRAVHLNLSMRSLDAALLGLIGNRLEEAGADPGDLVFELGEKQLAEAGAERVEFVRSVGELGCRLAVDNYMGGGRRTSPLGRFPLSYIKLDPELIGGVSGHAASRRKVTSIVLRGHRNGQRIIAQGVEDLLTLDALSGLGVDEAQGHVFGPAEPVEQALGSAI
jgi:EAL domain-containing protein (putative c-di-GMP-specific phosphodiesterase class I)